jgi:hypothetical protein
LFFSLFFIIIKILAIFNKKKIRKISRIYITKIKFAKQIPISLSKIGQILPEKKHWAGNELH